MKCLEAAAGRPSGAERIQGGGGLAVNYAAVLPRNLQPGAGLQARGKPRAKASSLGSRCWETIPSQALWLASTGSCGAWNSGAGASTKALPVPGLSVPVQAGS